MNKIFTPILLAVLTLASTLAVIPALPAFATGNAIVQTDSPVYTADIGTTFTVVVQVSNVVNLIGYDVTLHYDPSILAAQSVDFQGPDTLIGPFCAANQCLPIRHISIPGSIHSAYTLLSVSTTVSSSEALFMATFSVIGAGNSDLSISPASIVAETGGVAVAVPTTVMSGQYLPAPNLFFVPPNGQPAAAHTLHLFKGQTAINYTGLIQLDPNATSGAFGGVVITAINPTQTEVYTVTSTTAFMFPGQSATVWGIVDFSDNPQIGTYTVTVTMLRCPSPSACITGATAVGQPFKVKA